MYRGGGCVNASSLITNGKLVLRNRISLVIKLFDMPFAGRNRPSVLIERMQLKPVSKQVAAQYTVQNGRARCNLQGQVTCTLCLCARCCQGSHAPASRCPCRVRKPSKLRGLLSSKSSNASTCGYRYLNQVRKASESLEAFRTLGARVQALCCRLLEQAMRASFVSIDGPKSSMSFLLTLPET